MNALKGELRWGRGVDAEYQCQTMLVTRKCAKDTSRGRWGERGWEWRWEQERWESTGCKQQCLHRTRYTVQRAALPNSPHQVSSVHPATPSVMTGTEHLSPQKSQALAERPASGSNLLHRAEGPTPEQERPLYSESLLSSLACCEWRVLCLIAHVPV